MASAAQNPSRGQVLADLGSGLWEVRWRAVQALKKDESLLRDPSIQESLAHAYARTFYEPRQASEGGEWWGYRLDIETAVLRMKICCNAPLAAKALVDGADYDPYDVHGRELAADTVAYPALFAAASRPPRRDGKPDAARQNALVVLATAYAFSLGHAVTDGAPGAIFRNPNVRLTPARRAEISRLVWAVAENPRDPDRRSMIDALGMLGTERVKRYLMSLAVQGSGMPVAFEEWLVANGLSIADPGKVCQWLHRRSPGDAFAMVYRVATSPNGWDLAARSDLAAMYALAHGRPAPTHLGLLAAYGTVTGGPPLPPGHGDLVCRADGFRLEKSQLDAIETLIFAASKRPRLGLGAYQDLGVLGTEPAREFLAKEAAGSDAHAAFEARVGLGLWALSNGLPLPGFAHKSAPLPPPQAR